MTDKIKFIKPVVKMLAGFGVLMLTSTSANAQSSVLSKEAQIEALKIGKIIVNDNLVTEEISSLSELGLSNDNPEEKIQKLLYYVDGTVSLSNKFDPADILNKYQQIVSEFGNERDKGVYELYELYLNNVDLENIGEKISPQLTETLKNKTQDKDWFIANTAWRLLSLLNSQVSEVINLPLALEQAQNAYKIIPNEVSPYVRNARILTLEQTTFLQIRLLNPELAIESTAELIAQKQAAGHPIDGSSLLNNLIYTLSEWREYKVSTELAKNVLELEKRFTPNVPGLTELRVGRILNNQGKFPEALSLIDNGLSTVEMKAIRKNLVLARITALAGIGKVSEAETELETFTSNLIGTKLNKSNKNLIAAKAAIAIAKGNRSEAFRLTTALNDATAQNFLTKYNTNTSNLLANLENSKNRQAEREIALERETELKQEQLEQQQDINQLLMILLGLLGSAAILAVLFARYRDKISKVLELKTHEAESADRMKSEFLGMVSHELRTPLNGIVGIADLLSNTAPSEDLRYKAGIILDSSLQLTSVVESIVDMSRIDGGKMELYPEMTDVHSIVMDLDRLWRPTLEEKGVTFTCFVDNTLLDSVMLDKARFRQCLNSLLSNAANFTETGRVHMHVTSAPVEGTQDMDITAIVADTGQGITEEVQARLFTPFLQADSSMTRKHGGAGLSLSIAQSLARMMGGDVTLVSNAGRGSEFTLKVRGEKSEAAQVLDEVEALLDSVDTAPISDTPVNTADILPTQMERDIDVVIEDKDTDIPIVPPVKDAILGPSMAFDPDNLRGLKVLIVEDIPANQDVIKLFLTPEGCETLCALNGQQALQVLETQSIDVVIMDIRMPEMDGIQATRAIRQTEASYRNIPIIALTADASAQTNAECMAAGTDIFLTKPVMARDLTEAIRFLRRFQETEEDEALTA